MILGLFMAIDTILNRTRRTQKWNEGGRWECFIHRVFLEDNGDRHWDEVTVMAIFHCIRKCCRLVPGRILPGFEAIWRLHELSTACMFSAKTCSTPSSTMVLPTPFSMEKVVAFFCKTSNSLIECATFHPWKTHTGKWIFAAEFSLTWENNPYYIHVSVDFHRQISSTNYTSEPRNFIKMPVRKRQQIRKVNAKKNKNGKNQFRSKCFNLWRN